MPEILADIADKPNPERRHRSCPRAVKRARHNSYPVKKPGQTASTRHPGPATIQFWPLQGAGAEAPESRERQRTAA